MMEYLSKDSLSLAIGVKLVVVGVAALLVGDWVLRYWKRNANRLTQSHPTTHVKIDVWRGK